MFGIPIPAATTLRLIGIGLGAILLVLAIGLAVHSCDKRRSRAAQARVEHSQAQAASNSAADAIGTVANAGKSDAESEALTRSNEARIRKAEGANAAVNPAARDAGITALCKRRAYQDDPRCKP